MDINTSEFDLSVRYEVYRFFADQCRAPGYEEIAGLLKAEKEAVRDSFHKLHGRHMIFLEPGADAIRMANPFSAVPTRFRVRAGEKEWWANCAWDSLGIAAALHIDGEINASIPGRDEPLKLEVKNGRVDGKNQVIHFPLPCRRWYDDLVFT